LQILAIFRLSSLEKECADSPLFLEKNRFHFTNYSKCVTFLPSPARGYCAFFEVPRIQPRIFQHFTHKASRHSLRSWQNVQNFPSDSGAVLLTPEKTWDILIVGHETADHPRLSPSKGGFMMQYLPILWLVLLVVFAVAEGLTAGLVSIWFALGALAALIASLCSGSLPVQVVLFALVSVVAMAIIRPLAAKYFTPHQEATNADRIIGSTALVIVPIDNVNGTGQVKVGGKIWTARSETSDPIPEGTMVKILRIQGVKVTVEPAAVSTPQ
jgi:membrane protein implicated in regulation of membrane protease activity